MTDSDIQRVRLRFETQFRRIRNAEDVVFFSQIKQFWNYIIGTPNLLAAVEVLGKKHPDAQEIVRDLLDEKKSYTPAFGNAEDQAAVCACLLPELIRQNEESLIESIAWRYVKPDEGKSFFCDYYVEPLYSYLDDHMDNHNGVLSVLLDFKKRVEWFDHDEFSDLYDHNTQSGERLLAKEMYRYLFDRGVPINIEPSSASGRADMISQQFGIPLIADAKVYKDNKTTIITGYNQLYQYLGDFNESIGYLVIFNVSDANLSFEGEFEKNLIPAYARNGKTIYFLEIRLREESISASKQGKMQTVIVNSTELQINKEA